MWPERDDAILVLPAVDRLQEERGGEVGLVAGFVKEIDVWRTG